MGKRGPKPGTSKKKVEAATIGKPGAPPVVEIYDKAAGPSTNSFELASGLRTDEFVVHDVPLTQASEDVAKPIEPVSLETVQELEDAPLPGGGGDAPLPVTLDAARYITEDEFHQRVCVIYVIAGQSTPIWSKFATGVERPPLQSLIRAPEMPGARQAHDALYQTIVEVPWLNFLVERQTGLLARLSIIAMFGFTLGSAVYEEIRREWQPPIEGHAEEVETPASPPPETKPPFVPARPGR
jgi:hypothetical protein